MSLSVEDIQFLESAADKVVALELETGEMLFAEVVMVVNELPTPDVFVLRCLREADGVFVAVGTSGESFLLSEIKRVAGVPGVEYPGGISTGPV